MNLNSKEGTAGITALLVIAIVAAVNFLVGGLGLFNFRVANRIVTGFRRRRCCRLCGFGSQCSQCCNR